MNIQIWGTSKSFDTKKAERYFKERKIKYQLIDVSKQDGVYILYNACAEELGFDFNLKINGIKIFGPVILCCKRGFEYIDCTLTKAEVEKYFI